MRDDSGYFLILEGPDGTGKSTQLKNLDSWLQSLGVSTYRTHMPGGSKKYGDYLRSMLLDSKDRVHDLTELYGQNLDKALHIEGEIVPLLKSGTTVLCDRAFCSSTVYQGILKNKINIVQQLSYLFYAKDGPLSSHLHKMHEIILDAPDDVLRQRQEKRSTKLAEVNDKYELADDSFKQRVREAYRELDTLATPPYKRIRISSDGSKEEVQMRLQEYIRKVMHL